MKNINFLTIVSLSTLLLGTACTPTTAQHGNMLADYQLEAVVENVHTRSDVLRVLGSPTTQSPFDDNTWYYIGQKTEKRGVLDPKITDEQIIIVSFNEAGIVQSVRKSDEERINIPIERSKTQTQGNEITVIQQLLGNVGKFNSSGQQ